jgi:hypothetical protein
VSNTARTTYSIPVEYDRRVREEAARLGVYNSAIIRMALDLFFAQAPINESLLNEARIEARRELFEALVKVQGELREAWG